MKKRLFKHFALTLSSVASIAAPIAVVVSCGDKVTSAPTEVINFDKLIKANKSKEIQIKAAIEKIKAGDVSAIVFKGVKTSLKGYEAKDGNKAYEAIKDLVAELSIHYPTVLEGAKAGTINVPSYTYFQQKQNFPVPGTTFAVPEDFPSAPEHSKWKFAIPKLYQETSATGDKTDVWANLEAWQLPASFDFVTNSELLVKAKLVADPGFKLSIEKEYEMTYALPSDAIKFNGFKPGEVTIAHLNTNLENPDGAIKVNTLFDSTTTVMNVYDETGTTLIGTLNANGELSGLISGTYKIKAEKKPGIDAKFASYAALSMDFEIPKTVLSFAGFNTTNIVAQAQTATAQGTISLKAGWNLPDHITLDVMKGDVKVGALTNSTRSIDVDSANYKVVPSTDSAKAVVDPSVLPLTVGIAPVDAEAAIIADIKAAKLHTKIVDGVISMYGMSLPDRSMTLALNADVYTGAIADFEFKLVKQDKTIVGPLEHLDTGAKIKTGWNDDLKLAIQGAEALSEKIGIAIYKASDHSLLQVVWLNPAIMQDQIEYKFTFDSASATL